jgi:hypothetical protein
MRSLRTKINTEKYYVISGEKLKRVQQATLRIYSENKFKGNEMRDLAQNLEFVVLEAMEEDGEF